MFRVAQRQTFAFVVGRVLLLLLVLAAPTAVGATCASSTSRKRWTWKQWLVRATTFILRRASLSFLIHLAPTSRKCDFSILGPSLATETLSF